MSKELSNLSTKGLDEQSIGSVYDFLYYDAKRIASFLSQFDNSGNLKEVIQDESIQRTTQSRGRLSAGAGIPTVARGEGEHSTSVEESDFRAGHRRYDPVWTNARTFLDFLDERDLIKRDISSSNMGQFVLCSGTLSVSDLQLMERAWKLKSVQSLIKQGQRGSTGNRNIRRGRGKSGSANPEIDLVLELLSIMPHTIQAKLSGVANVWCSLDQEAMSTVVSDIPLKHGVVIPGEWHALGILDARPGISTPSDPDMSDGVEIAGKMMEIFGPVIRNLLGRPNDHYGITPLLIFREVF